MRLEEAVELAKKIFKNDDIDLLDEESIDSIESRIVKAILQQNYHVES